MRRTMSLPAIFGLALLTNLPARADFVLGFPSTAMVAPATTTVALASPSTAASVAPEPLDAPEKPIRFKVARGFGRNIPLAFAVRQIVPPGIAVRYGLGVDHDIAVTWAGGTPWNRTLASAVRPLGLRIETSATVVLISR